SHLQSFSLFLSILLRMDKNSPFSERLNDSGTLSHTLPKALPLESGREQAAPCTLAILRHQLKRKASLLSQM
ncbi:MAG: hypothetical protein K5979_06585, partial [Ruminococcus sp.]|nr:hypothetical protein [Ruminococcus sp.]